MAFSDLWEHAGEDFQAEVLFVPETVGPALENPDLVVEALDEAKRHFIPGDIQQTALRKLRMISNALTINDLRIPPANRLEKLSGNRAGQFSIRINDQWRICFIWREGNTYDVEITEYH